MQQVTVQDRAAQRLLARSPQETDAALAGLLQQRSGLLVVSKEKNTFHDNGTVTTERLPVCVSGTASDDEIRKAIADYELAMTAAPVTEIVKLVSVLRVTTASRNADGQDSELLLEAYSRALSAYPADVVGAVLKRLRKWFPTLIELVEECEAMTAHRKDVMRALRDMLEGRGKPALPQPARPQISDEQRADLVARFASMRASIGAEAKQQACADKWKSPDQILAELEAMKDMPLQVSPRLKSLLQEQINDESQMRAIRERVAMANSGKDE